MPTDADTGFPFFSELSDVTGSKPNLIDAFFPGFHRNDSFKKAVSSAEDEEKKSVRPLVKVLVRYRD